MASATLRIAVCFSFFALALPSSGEESAVHFSRDIRPILSDKCFFCHGPDEKKREADLRLDIESAVFASRDTPLIVRGEPDKSELFHRLVTEDDDERMPPTDSRKSLSEAEKSLIRKWIEQGATWTGHWAYEPLHQPVVPSLPDRDDAGFLRGPIDQFVLARLQGADLQPNSAAEPLTLARRLYFDLLGLPPSPKEAAEFASDPSSQEYEKLVDRLLANEHFGERMALYWLDVARYADSNGYHGDNPRQMWLYRNYVIDAFNNNMPFDQFTIEQLAGDLLPEAGTRGLIASAYNRLLQTTQEGGAQAKEYEAKYAADRVRNTANAWLGTTMGCVECHNHKYDPFTQSDFYSFAAFFSDIEEPAVGGPPHDKIYTDADRAKVQEYDQQLAAVRAEIASQLASIEYREPTTAPQPEVESRCELVWIDDVAPQGASLQGDSPWDFVSLPDHPVLSGEKSTRRSAEGLSQHFFLNANPPLVIGEGDTLFAHVYVDPKNPPQSIMMQFNDGSWEHRVYWGEDRIPFGAGGKENHLSQGPLPDAGAWVRLEVTASAVGLAPGAKLNGWAFTQFGGTVYWDKAGIVTNTDQNTPKSFESLLAWEAYEAKREKSDVPQSVREAIKKAAGDRSEAQQKQVRDHFLEHVYPPTRDVFVPLHVRLTDIEKQKQAFVASIPELVVTKTKSNPRTVRVLARGNWQDESGEVVTPAIPEFFGMLAVKDRRANRLDLARWIASADNPLTARVFVNRVWMLFFGAGLSPNVDDLGSQGTLPTHPDLLDWLAADFIEHGWDVKRLVKQIVMSGTYRQSSKASPEMRARDPYNHLLARQGRWRLDAEMVRDQALQVSGLLVPQIGGPSVKPYQPAGYWSHLKFPNRSWTHDSGESQYRRGLYTWWQRTFLHPSLMAFDAPSREECVARRDRSNTPLQALVLLNDPTYVEAARKLAERVIREGGSNYEDRVRFVWRLLTSREPSDEEIQVFAALHRSQHAEYVADKSLADQLLSVGLAPRDATVDSAELAAWTDVARAALSLHEAITRY
ncbi:MAG: PSD1 domain-containing protein [Planctomycetales bacterium]|nr:PSD1 domain-containing protein [Planctomycetales bacterium]